MGNLLYGLIFSFYRMWFGGLFKYTFLGNVRGIQHFVMILSMFLCWFNYEWNDWRAYIPALIASIFVQFQFWGRAVGPVLDVGISPYPTEDMKERYSDRWYYYACNLLIPERFRYGKVYDVIYSSMRYGLPMLLVSIIFDEYLFLAVGLSITPIYMLSNLLVGNKKWDFYGEEIEAKTFGEFFGGLTFGLVLYNANLYNTNLLGDLIWTLETLIK